MQNSEYVSLEPDADGVIKSRVFPGLWLDLRALLAGEMTKVLVVVQQGLNNTEHADFVQRLAR